MITAPSRRGFTLGLVGLFAAPAIVRIGSIMPVKANPVTFTGDYALRMGDAVEFEGELYRVAYMVSGQRVFVRDTVTGGTLWFSPTPPAHHSNAALPPRL